MRLIAVCLLGYLIGAIPFAYVIGKVFFHTDVRKHGSGNLGGSNTGRVLGKKAGVAVMTLDLLKVTLVIFLAGVITDHHLAVSLGCLSAALGHCYPVFVRFRGGKAVAALYGVFFGLWVFGGYAAWIFFLPLITFLVVLRLFRIVALSSMLSAVGAVLYLFCIGAEHSISMTVLLLTILIILRHKENIRRMLHGNENKIRWM